MFVRGILTTIITFLLLFDGFSTNWIDYSSYNLVAPVDTPLLLSGSFAELRAHHFHAGLDFKTQGVTGRPIYAAADGYVSRIKISSSGYGKALYIDHPELNLTTVYGHLKDYIPVIEKVAKDKHYELEEYNLDFFLEKDLIKVKKGDLIAYSGNTGSSGGPHLHFETRERHSQTPINPLLFGFPIKDTTSPSINGLRIYPQEGQGSVNGISKGSKFFPIVYYNGKYHLKGSPNINVWGHIGFGVSTLDYFDGSWSKCGIYSIKLLVDGQPIFNQVMDKVSYDQMRFIDAHIDQEVRRKSRVDYQYSFMAKANNPLSIYKEMTEDGLINFSDSQVHEVEYQIKDQHGNTSVLTFNVHSKKQSIVTPLDSSQRILNWEKAHHFGNEQFHLSIPAKAMYEDQAVSFNIDSSLKYLSAIFEINNNHKLLNKKATIKIRPNKNTNIPVEKMVICKVRDNNKLNVLPTKHDGQYLTTKVYNFSKFTVACDTIPPTLRPVNIYSGKRFTQAATFGFKVHDDFTGLWDYSATIDGKWALFYYEAKKNYIYYKIDPSRLEKGQIHDLYFEAWDATDNSVSHKTSFYW